MQRHTRQRERAHGAVEWWRAAAEDGRRARAISATNPVLRVNDLLAFTGNIDWEKGNLNTVGNVPAVNIEDFDRLTTGWQDVWIGGSNKRGAATSTAAT